VATVLSRLRRCLGFALSAGLVLGALSSAAAAREPVGAIASVPAPDAMRSGPGAGDTQAPDPQIVREQQIIAAVCGKCHPLELVMDTAMSYEAWHDTVQKMIDHGADASADQLDDIMDYLHRMMTTVNVNTAGVDELQIVLNVPESVAKAIIARRSSRRFSSLEDLKSVPGIGPATLTAKAKMIFFS
jgi:competence ComEA-like helix-hairpin-helix protein